MSVFQDRDWEIEQMWKAVEYYERGAEEASNLFDRQKLYSQACKLREKISDMRATHEQTSY